MPSQPVRYVFDFDAPPEGDSGALTRLLGGKGANLVAMAHRLRLPVPVGFTITTEACRSYLAGAWPAGLNDELREHMARLGALVGRRFGDPGDPLLVSVRSGAPVSMPGMMDTILDLGVTAATVAGLARSSGSTDFADDCRRRLAEGWRAVIGDKEVPDDPWTQLRVAVEAVFRSWNSDRARAYRKVEGVADDLGTAVTVQAMVFGNRGGDSGTGVLFTRNPSTGERVLYGDFMFNAQGEDVVAGDHVTESLSALDERLPAVAEQLRRHCGVLEHHLADVGDVEFTVEDGRLWLLQVRAGKRSPRAALRMAIDMADDPEFPLSREEALNRVRGYLNDPPRVFSFDGPVPQPITTGLPASPGVASGVIVLAADAAMNADRPVILVRRETSPEDVGGMAKAAGVLTATGGLASHAAVVARGWGIPAVVGAADVQPADDHVMVAGRRLAAGDVITIDGSTGHVYMGEIAGRWEVAPEVATLLAWAKELGIEIGGGAATETSETRVEVGSTTRDDALRTLLIKGMAAADALPGGSAELTADGLAEATDDGLRLTSAGKEAAAALFAADAVSIGEARGLELLEQFHELDERMKLIVTAWQIRDIGGLQALNDHTDAGYDTKVLGDLAALHSDAAKWLQQLAPVGQRFSAYRERLAHAAELARSDQRYVASPRVDSVHTVWFELHEDLIRTTGRNRADEVAAGRA